MPGFKMQDAGYTMRTRCARFPVPDSALGARYPAFGVDPVPGIRFQVPGPGTWNPVPDTQH